MTFSVTIFDNLGQLAGSSVSVVCAGLTAGRSLVARLAWYSGAVETISSVTCSGESDLTVHGSPLYNATNNEAIQFASLPILSGGGSKTVTLTLSGSVSYRSIVVWEVAGGSTGDFFEAVGTAAGSSTNPTGSVTTANDNCLILGVASSSATGYTTQGTGYTWYDLSVHSGNISGADSIEYDLDGGTAGVISVPFVNSNSGAWSVLAAAFNPAGPTGDAAFNLPALTFTGTGTFLGFFRDLPKLTLAAGNPSAIFDLPMLTFSGTGVTLVPTAFNLPALTLVGVGAMGGAGLAEFNLPMLTFTGAGSTGDVGTATFDLPAITLFATGVDRAAFSLPLITLDAVGKTGGVGSAAFSLPKLTFSTAGQQDGVGTGAFNLPGAILVAVGLTGGTGAAAFNLPFPTLSAIGFTGVLGTAAFDLPVLTLSVEAYHSVTGDAAFDLPLLYMDAQGAVTLTSSYRTWVVNVRKGAVTEYDSFSFNSFAHFNGAVLACGPSGVFTLGTQSTDAGTAISAKYRTAVSPLGDTAWVKRVPRLYVQGSQDGDTIFRTITVEGGTRSYQLVWNKLSGTQQRRVPVGKGPKSQYWQFEQENVSGSDFSTGSLMAYPTKLRRRIAG